MSASSTYGVVWTRYSFISKAFRDFNTRRQQVEETYHVTFDESMEAIRFANTSEDEIGIDDSSRYPPDEFIHEDDPSRQYQANFYILYYVIPHVIIQPTKGTSGNNTEVSVSISKFLVPGIPQSLVSNQAIISSHHVPQNRWSKDQHIEVVNIIGNPGEGMLKRSMASKLTAASANECLFVDFLSEIEPKKVTEALKHPGWVDVMQEELNQFYKNKVWTLVPLHSGKTTIGFKWVFMNKKDEHGTTTKNKARLVNSPTSLDCKSSRMTKESPSFKNGTLGTYSRNMKFLIVPVRNRENTRSLPIGYYKDDSCSSADLKSKTTEDIISIGSFMEVLVLNHYVLVRKILTGIEWGRGVMAIDALLLSGGDGELVVKEMLMVSLVDGVLEGALRALGDEFGSLGDGVFMSSWVKSINNYFGRMMLILVSWRPWKWKLYVEAMTVYGCLMKGKEMVI
ncbi:retrovirus-related pol polyprotein from transposon TNT 1-94 [Tanacetum coccineum]